MRIPTKRLGTRTLSKYCPQIPYYFLCLVVTFTVLPFSGRTAYFMSISLAWGAESEADLAGYKIYHKGGDQVSVIAGW